MTRWAIALICAVAVWLAFSYALGPSTASQVAAAVVAVGVAAFVVVGTR